MRSKIEIYGSILEQVNVIIWNANWVYTVNQILAQKQIPKNVRRYQKTFKENSYRHTNEIL